MTVAGNGNIVGKSGHLARGVTPTVLPVCGGPGVMSASMADMGRENIVTPTQAGWSEPPGTVSRLGALAAGVTEHRSGGAGDGTGAPTVQRADNSFLPNVK